MRHAMFEAEVGDDGYREDPTVNCTYFYFILFYNTGRTL